MVQTVVLCVQMRQRQWHRNRIQTNPHTSLQNVSVYLSTGSACTWWKVKSNITCASRYGKLQPMRLDIPSSTSLQWSNKEWSGRAVVSWINIKGQTDCVNTWLVTFIGMHSIVVCIKQRILRWDLHTTVNTRWKENHSTLLKTWRRAGNKSCVLGWGGSTERHLNAPDISFMFYACTCLI